MNNPRLIVFSMVLALLQGGCEALPRGNATAAAPDFEIFASEREQAVSLAQGTGSFKEASARQPVYFVDVDVFRDKQVDDDREGPRQILVTHYAAATDTAILTRVNLDTQKVLGVETVPHLPVALSQEEYEIAKRMALEHPRVKEALAGRSVEVEAQLSRTADENDPQYRHRVIHFLFKTPRGYLDSPAVFVDLTAGEIVVE